MKLPTELYYRELVDGKRQGLPDRLLLGLLKLLAVAYGGLLRLRGSAYRLGWLGSYRLPVPVISVGNIVLGGTGKTPMVVWLAGYLMARGKRVAVISRGYGGSAEGELRIVSDGRRMLLSPEQAGDEPYLLAQKVPGLMVVIGADRYQAGLLALKELNPDIFILDDGFQHLRLRRDLNILLLDAAKPFGNGRTLPAGYLREPISAAERADLVVYTRCATGARPDLFPGKPSCWTSHKLSGMMPLGGGSHTGFEMAKGARVTAFSGIADPGAFFDLLEQEGIRLTATLAFPDHASYGDEEISAICRLKDASRSTLLITTEKDAVKLIPFMERLATCFVTVLEIDSDDSAPLRAVLEKLL
ncbi:MAG: tetraacyldisaccharide 4'-kinase [Geobacteraceae bacterium GWC2_58_44]|nr:MAG: tetraacyldisaccharide 4'-kinase [Geobacteraceae bacterium GWC2_58_44]HBG05004.1 tetraacyldisaccharide 4'-kinase [Geobacter sp.]